MVGFRNLWSGWGGTVQASAHMLYTDLAAAALQPVLYEQGAARDTFEGRAAMITAFEAHRLGPRTKDRRTCESSGAGWI